MYKGYGGWQQLESLATSCCFFLMRCNGGAARACAVVLNLACSILGAAAVPKGSNRSSGTCFLWLAKAQGQH